MISVIDKQTGEVIELPTDTTADLIMAWQTAMQYEKLAKQIKDDVKKYLLTRLNEFDETEEAGKYKFKRSIVQRYTYDKTAVRRILDDEDLLDDFLVIDKTVLDRYVKDNLTDLGPISTELRQALVPLGKPYERFSLEKVSL